MADTYSSISRISIRKAFDTVEVDGFKALPVVTTVALSADVLATTDAIKLFDSCPHAYVWVLTLNFEDLDTSTSPTLVFKIVGRDLSGTPTDLVTGITAGQTGATYTLTEPLTLHNQTLWLEASTAADTAAAGDVAVKALIVRGEYDYTGFEWKG